MPEEKKKMTAGNYLFVFLDRVDKLEKGGLNPRDARITAAHEIGKKITEGDLFNEIEDFVLYDFAGQSENIADEEDKEASERLIKELLQESPEMLENTLTAKYLKETYGGKVIKQEGKKVDIDAGELYDAHGERLMAEDLDRLKSTFKNMDDALAEFYTDSAKAKLKLVKSRIEKKLETEGPIRNQFRQTAGIRKTEGELLEPLYNETEGYARAGPTQVPNYKAKASA